MKPSAARSLIVDASVTMLGLWMPGVALAQSGGAEPSAMEPTVITANRTERPLTQVPASIDRIDAARIQDSQRQVNLSEVLSGVAGVVANDRQNYTQDLQISIRGFGARSTFGVRGIRVLVDGVPATMPDGQGQISHIALSSAQRIEVLRGPFSSLYGNSSGGVIQVFSNYDTAGTSAAASVASGSFRTSRIGLTAVAGTSALGGMADASHFETEGYRDHSAAMRDTVNATLHANLAPATTLKLVGNSVTMPNVQDPLGLTRAQMEAQPSSVDPSAILFNTRKSVDQQQGGAVVEHALGSLGAVQLTTYYGQRATQQFQAIPVATQASPLHPGGVIDLSRQYAGADLRWTWRGALLERPFSLAAGVNYDALHENRRGYLNFSGNTLGVQGALRRDEVNVVANFDQYVQGEWQFAPDWLALAGVRASHISLDSTDHYVTSANPDDSGNTSYSAVTPVAGLNLRLRPGFSLYASVGAGFETPTLNETAYRPDGKSGLNLDLRPSRSTNYEAGAKLARWDGWLVTGALFHVDTRDELVVQTNAGGRSTFQNAGATRRDGAELSVDKNWASGFGVSAAFTALRAVYADSFLTCATTPCSVPATRVEAGARLPGIPARSAYVDLRWGDPAGFELGVETRYADRLFVNDVNSDAAGAYTVVNARAAYNWRKGNVVARPFVRMDNAFDRRYAGSVIVNESNSRYFEPAPGRNVLAGVTVRVSFD